MEKITENIKSGKNNNYIPKMPIEIDIYENEKRD